MANVDTTGNIQINGIEIEKVTDYKYSGTNNSNGKQHKTRSFNQNKSRMECVLGKYREIFPDRHLPMSIKRKLL